MLVDLTQATFEEFVAFVFAHPVAGGDAKEWYRADELELRIDPARQIAYLTQVFLHPKLLAGRFTNDQLEQGFWFMFAARMEDFSELLWEPTIGWPEREACIRAIADLYAGLFADHPLETFSYMMWDLLADGYGHGWRQPETDDEARRVQGVMFQTLRKILSLPESHCQQAALHGLNHLAHPNGSSVIREFLDSHASLDVSLRQYAEEAMVGRAL